MTLPVPVEMTATVGGILTAAEWNSNVRDGVNFLANPPLFVGAQTTSQSIPNSTNTSVAFDTNVIDTYNGHSTTVNNPQYIAKVAGTYLVYASIGFSGNATGARVLFFLLNGVAYSDARADEGGNANTQDVQLQYFIPMNAGDNISCLVLQTSGGALSLAGGRTSFQAKWVHS